MRVPASGGRVMNSCGTDCSRCIKRGPIVKGSEKSLSVLIYTTEKGAYFEFSGIFSEASEVEKISTTPAPLWLPVTESPS